MWVKNGVEAKTFLLPKISRPFDPETSPRFWIGNSQSKNERIGRFQLNVKVIGQQRGSVDFIDGCGTFREKGRFKKLQRDVYYFVLHKIQ